MFRKYNYFRITLILIYETSLFARRSRRPCLPFASVIRAVGRTHIRQAGKYACRNSPSRRRAARHRKFHILPCERNRTRFGYGRNRRTYDRRRRTYRLPRPYDRPHHRRQGQHRDYDPRLAPHFPPSGFPQRRSDGRTASYPRRSPCAG